MGHEVAHEPLVYITQSDVLFTYRLHGAAKENEMRNMTAAQMKTIIASEAAKYGFTIDRTDLRSNVYFLRRGTEVRRGWTFRRMNEVTLMISVQNTVSHGRRLDTDRLSMYFNPEA